MAKGLSDKRLLELARKAVPGLETLQTRNSDRLDFHEICAAAHISCYVRKIVMCRSLSFPRYSVKSC